MFDALIAYSRSSTSQRIHDQDIIEGFTKFLLTDFRQDAGHIFSRFMLSEENDKESEPNYIISGLKDITESTDLNTIGSRTTNRRSISIRKNRSVHMNKGWNGYPVLSFNTDIVLLCFPYWRLPLRECRRDDTSAVGSSARAEVDDVVGVAYHVQIVSMTTRVAPAESRCRKTSSNVLTSSGWSPMVGSSKRRASRFAGVPSPRRVSASCASPPLRDWAWLRRG